MRILSRALPIVLFALAGVIAVAPFFSRTIRSDNGYPTAMLWTDDFPNHFAYSQQFDKVFRSGIIYPRWIPDVNNGYGVATMVFYPPGMHYLALVFHAVLGDWMDAYFAIAALALAASGLSFYCLSRLFFGRLAATLASLFYMLFPFHVLNLYYQGAVPQFMGYAFMPWIIYLAYKLGTQGRLIHCAGLGVIYGLYLMTHLPVSYLFTYVLALYAILWAARERNIRIALRISGGMLLGLLFSAIYWLPAALESKYVYEWASEWLPYHQSYVTPLASKDMLYFTVNLSFWLIIATIFVAVLIRMVRGKALGLSERNADGSALVQAGLWILLAIFAVFMSTDYSFYVSRLIPRIGVATPPWRWLAIATFFASLIVTAALERLIRSFSRLSWREPAYAAVFVMLFASSLWVTVRYAILDPVRTQRSYVFPAVHIDSGFTPIQATRPDKLPNTPAAIVESGAADVIEWLPQHRIVEASANQPSELRLKTYYYPGWVARIDGVTVPIAADKDGAQLILVPPGKHEVETEFVDTPPRTSGKAIFAFSVVAIVGLSLTDVIRRKRILKGTPSEMAESS